MSIYNTPPSSSAAEMSTPNTQASFCFSEEQSESSSKINSTAMEIFSYFSELDEPFPCVGNYFNEETKQFDFDYIDFNDLYPESRVSEPNSFSMLSEQEQCLSPLSCFISPCNTPLNTLSPYRSEVFFSEDIADKIFSPLPFQEHEGYKPTNQEFSSTPNLRTSSLSDPNSISTVQAPIPSRKDPSFEKTEPKKTEKTGARRKFELEAIENLIEKQKNGIPLTGDEKTILYEINYFKYLRFRNAKHKENANAFLIKAQRQERSLRKKKCIEYFQQKNILEKPTTKEQNALSFSTFLEPFHNSATTISPPTEGIEDFFENFLAEPEKEPEVIASKSLVTAGKRKRSSVLPPMPSGSSSTSKSSFINSPPAKKRAAEQVAATKTKFHLEAIEKLVEKQKNHLPLTEEEKGLVEQLIKLNPIKFVANNTYTYTATDKDQIIKQRKDQRYQRLIRERKCNDHFREQRVIAFKEKIDKKHNDDFWWT